MLHVAGPADAVRPVSQRHLQVERAEQVPAVAVMDVELRAVLVHVDVQIVGADGVERVVEHDTPDALALQPPADDEPVTPCRDVPVHHPPPPPARHPRCTRPSGP